MVSAPECIKNRLAAGPGPAGELHQTSSMDLWGEESGGRHKDRGGVGKVDEKGGDHKRKGGRVCEGKNRNRGGKNQGMKGTKWRREMKSGKKMRLPPYLFLNVVAY